MAVGTRGKMARRWRMEPKKSHLHAAVASLLAVASVVATTQVLALQAVSAAGPPPATAVILPSAGATETGSFYLDALASSPVGVASVNFQITTVPGIRNALFGCDGIFLAVLSGPGTVWLQTLPISRLAHQIAEYMPGREGGAGRAGVGGALLGGIVGSLLSRDDN